MVKDCSGRHPLTIVYDADDSSSRVSEAVHQAAWCYFTTHRAGSVDSRYPNETAEGGCPTHDQSDITVVKHLFGSEETLAILPQLLNVESYQPCEWEFKEDPTGRDYWSNLFCEHLDILMEAISQQYPETSPETLSAFQTRYLADMQSIVTNPERFEHINILTFDRLRVNLQHEFGLLDPYLEIKRRENAAALAMLPELLAELDSTPTDQQPEKLAFGLMAGNIFDMGAAAAVERYNAHGADFRHLRDSQPVRPWFIDDLDRWRERWLQGPGYRHAAFFVDNSGSDICLGCLPLARWMLQQGTRVTLAANSEPALNDVTAPELIPILGEIARFDPLTDNALRDGRLACLASGGWAPLLDLTGLSDECVALIADADLLILQGMGRSVESNFDARFTCDCLRSAVIKDPAVAHRAGGKLFDCIFRHQKAG